MIFVSFWWSLGFHITSRHVGKPLLQEPSLSTSSFFLGFFPPLLKGQTLCSVVLFPLFCQRHGAGYNFSTRKEEVDACLVHVYTLKPYASQPRPHAFIACMFTATASCDLMGQGRATPDPAQGQSWCCTKGASVSERSSPRHTWAKSWHHNPAPATEPCTFPFPAHGSTRCQKKSRARYKPQLGPCTSDSYLYTTWVFIRCHEISFGGK